MAWASSTKSCFSTRPVSKSKSHLSWQNSLLCQNWLFWIRPFFGNFFLRDLGYWQIGKFIILGQNCQGYGNESGNYFRNFQLGAQVGKIYSSDTIYLRFWPGDKSHSLSWCIFHSSAYKFYRRYKSSNWALWPICRNSGYLTKVSFSIQV